jgi:hypothetical protein
MSIGLNASQARANSKQDLVVFNEIVAIMQAIITASSQGLYETSIDDGTEMTNSSPVSTMIGSVVNPTVLLGSQLDINGYSITLGTSGSHLNGVISDINDANIPGITASKQDGKLVLTIVHEQQPTWSYTIGSGSANTYLGLNQGLYVAENPSSVDYFSVWQGTDTNRGLSQQMRDVITFFNNIGYRIDRLSNTTTNKTFVWHVYW